MDGKRVFIYDVRIWLLLLTAGPLEHLGSLQLVQYLKHYFEKSGGKEKKNKKEKICYWKRGRDSNWMSRGLDEHVHLGCK